MTCVPGPDITTPYLLVTAPCVNMRTGEQPWWARTTITLEYAIRLEPAAASRPARAGR